MKSKILIFLFGIFAFTSVNAATYTNSTNMTEGTNSNLLINIASSRVENYLDHNYVIFQSDTSYYMILFKKYTSSGNSVTMSDTTIIRYYRTGTNNNTYTYSITNEGSTTFNSSYLFVSNLNINNASVSTLFNELSDRRNNTYLLMFILALIFASFLLKERSCY